MCLQGKEQSCMHLLSTCAYKYWQHLPQQHYMHTCCLQQLLPSKRQCTNWDWERERSSIKLSSRLSWKRRDIDVMYAQLTKGSIVRGHHVYKGVWWSIIGQQLPVFQEPSNQHDKRAVAVFNDGIIVGHVPRELSKVLWFFLKHDGKIICEITGRRKRGNGLEVPCIYKLSGPSSLIEKARKLL